MTDSAMLKSAAIGKLMDLQDICNRVLLGEEGLYNDNTNVRDMAADILSIIRAGHDH